MSNLTTGALRSPFLSRSPRPALALAAVLLAAAGCSLSGGGSTPTTATSSIPAGSQPAVDAAVSELARQTAMDAGEISVISVEATDWPDPSLGCPKPGLMYPQVITPGYRIVLETQGATYEYHTDTSGQRAVTCGS
jgi:hypothetical protein